MKKVKEENESKTRVLTINDVSTEIVETSLKSVVLEGVSLTLTLASKFHSQIVEWNLDEQRNIFHQEVRETSVLFNVFSLSLSKVETDREYVISKVFSQMRTFYKENGTVAVMPPFMPALLLGAKGFVAHNLRQVEGEDCVRMSTFFVITQASAAMPEMLVKDILAWKPVAHQKKDNE